MDTVLVKVVSKAMAHGRGICWCAAGTFADPATVKMSSCILNESLMGAFGAALRLLVGLARAEGPQDPLKDPGHH